MKMPNQLRFALALIVAFPLTLAFAAPNNEWGTARLAGTGGTPPATAQSDYLVFGRKNGLLDINTVHTKLGYNTASTPGQFRDGYVIATSGSQTGKGVWFANLISFNNSLGLDQNFAIEFSNVNGFSKYRATNLKQKVPTQYNTGTGPRTGCDLNLVAATFPDTPALTGRWDKNSALIHLDFPTNAGETYDVYKSENPSCCGSSTSNGFYTRYLRDQSGPVTISPWTLSGLRNRNLVGYTYYFMIVAKDASGVRSLPSTEVAVTITSFAWRHRHTAPSSSVYFPGQDFQVSLTLTSATRSTDVNVILVWNSGTQPGLNPPYSDAITGSWSLYTTPAAVFSADVVFSYLDTWVPGSMVEADMQSMRWNGSAWVSPSGTCNTTANTVSVTGISQTGTYTLGSTTVLPTMNQWGILLALLALSMLLVRAVKYPTIRNKA